MNCEHIQNDILLEQSGELGWLGRRRLTRHLSACAACRAYRAELAAITRAAAPRADDRAAESTDAIINFARRQMPSRAVEIRLRPSHESPWVTWRPALAYAGFGIVVATMFVLIMRPFLQPAEYAAPPAPAPAMTAAAGSEADWNADELDSRIDELAGLVTVNGDDWNGTAAASDDLDAVATELLAWEGETI